MPTIFERITDVIKRDFRVDETALKLEASFVDDLYMDSLDIVNLLFALEDEFSTDGSYLEISAKDAEKIITLQDAVDYLRSLGIADS